VRRGWCGTCQASHGLVPSFCLLGRLDVVEVVGEALSEVVGGRGEVRPVAARLDVPHTTARDWLRRFACRAGILTAGFAALVVKLCGLAPVLPADPSHHALGAMALAYAAARSRAGPLLPALWPFVAVVTGGKLLSTNTDPLVGPRRLSFHASRPMSTTTRRNTTWPTSSLRRSHYTAGR